MSFTTPLVPLGQRREDAVERALRCRDRVNTAHADVWEYVAALCDVAAAEEALMPAAGVVHTWAYGGPGTPLVPEGAVVEIAAELGESRQAAARLVAVSMNLCHRLPRVRAVVESGVVDWRKAETVAATTLHLPAQVVADVQDVLLPDGTDPAASLLARITRRRLDDLITQVQLITDSDAVTDDVEAALTARDVSVGRSDRLGVTDITGTLSSEDGARLASRIRQVARWLRESGDIRPAGIRRSVALGMLADPARLQQLWDQVQDLRHARWATEDTEATPDPDALPQTPRAGVPGTRLFVHLDRQTGTWTLDGTSATDPCAGPLSRAEAIRLVGHHHVTITPVLDLAAELTYTSYTAPPTLKTQLAQRNHGTCAFPSCTRHANIPAGTAGVDFDHQPPWPTGRTRSRDGTMLCRAHHRAKTFLGWHVHQPTPGTWLWTAPTRRHYLVTAGTTTPLH